MYKVFQLYLAVCYGYLYKMGLDFYSGKRVILTGILKYHLKVRCLRIFMPECLCQSNNLHLSYLFYSIYLQVKPFSRGTLKFLQEQACDIILTHS